MFTKLLLRSSVLYRAYIILFASVIFLLGFYLQILGSSKMTLNVEEGFHKGTLISCVLIATFGTMFAMMLAPNTPYLIRMYLPNVDIRY